MNMHALLLPLTVTHSHSQSNPEQHSHNPQAPQLTQFSKSVPAAGANITLSFTKGLTPNSDFVVHLVARDSSGNCQPRFTSVPVHTADNIPPVTLAMRLANVTGTSAELHVQLDEPGTAIFAVFDSEQMPGCPSAADMFASSGGQPNSTAVVSGSVTVPARAPAEAVAPLQGLTSETRYLACVVAEDSTQLHNQQSAVRHLNFTTLDVTPPAVKVNVKRSADGEDVACTHAPPHLCYASWTIELSESGSVRWLLLQNDSLLSATPLPGPATMLTAAELTSIFPGGSAVAEGRISFPPSPSAPVVVASLPSNAAYALVVAASDNAMPLPNTPAAVTVQVLLAPDVQPPTFLESGLVAAADSSLECAVRLDEPATTYFVLAANPSRTPNTTEVLAGLSAGGGTSVEAAGSVSSMQSNVSVPLEISGLAAGHLYDLHLVAVDASDNEQTNVTTLR